MDFYILFPDYIFPYQHRDRGYCICETRHVLLMYFIKTEEIPVTSRGRKVKISKEKKSSI